MNTKSISKEVLINFLRCPKRAWLAAYGHVELSRSIGTDALLEQGMQVHDVARTAFTGAKRIASGKLSESAVKITNDFVIGSDGVVLNSEFVSGILSARIDVLEKVGNNFKIIDIRSSSSVKDVYLNDCAVQFVCATDNGLNVESVEIFHPNTKIARTENGNGLEVFVKKDVTIEVKNLAPKVVHWIKDFTTTLNGDMPSCDFGEQCKVPGECPYLLLCKPQSFVIKSVDSVDYLPCKTGLVKELIASGVSKISDLSVIALTNKRNSLVYDAIVQNAGVVSESVQTQLKDLPYPQFFIDFETCAFPIPKFAGMRPYQPLLFQWSCHVKQDAVSDLTHSEFMDVTGNDPRQKFLEALIQTVGDDGSIFVFSSYEKLRLEELSDDFPVFKDAIDTALSKLTITKLYNMHT